MRCISLVSAMVLGFAMVGCGSSDDASDDPDQGKTETTQIELFSWWTQPGEAEALQALVELHRSEFPNERIYNAAEEDGPEAKSVLSQRLDDGDPPDLFQNNAYEMRAFLAAHPDAIEPLDDLFDAEGLNDAVAPEVLENVTVDGHVIAMPVNIHRENALFYNKSIFKKYDLEAPKTLDDFLSVCETLKGEGVTPVAVSTSQGWIISKLFNELAMGSMGAESFADFLAGKNFDEDKLNGAIDVLDKVLTDYIDVDASAVDGYGWTNATEAVYDGHAAMFLHGDWAKGYFVELGWEPNVDFGVVGAPGASDMFLYGVDVFGLPNGAKHPEAARDFLTTIGSEKGQIAFNTVKGSSPMRLDIDAKDFDSMGQEVIEDFKGAKIRMALIWQNAWDEAMLTFAKDHDKAALLQAFKDTPPAP